MKKKTLLLSLVSLLVIAASIFGIVSCNKDSNSGSSNSTGVVGTWVGSDLTLIFNSDGTGIVIENYDYYGQKGSQRYTFTYTMTGTNSGKITASEIDDDGVIVTFKITDGNTMILYGSYEDYDYEWVIDVLTRQGGNPSGGGSTANVVGTWYGQHGSSQTLTLTFNANNTGTYAYYYRDSYSGDEYESGSFTYSMSDSQNGYIHWYYDDGYGEETIRFSVSGTTMYLYDDDYYGYGEVTWTLTKR